MAVNKELDMAAIKLHMEALDKSVAAVVAAAVATKLVREALDRAQAKSRPRAVVAAVTKLHKELLARLVNSVVVRRRRKGKCRKVAAVAAAVVAAAAIKLVKGVA